MRIAPNSRSPLLQWLSFALCACVLVNALACGVLHLQALGVGSDKGQKASVGLFCVAGASQWLSLDPDDGSAGDPAPVNPQLPMSCPMSVSYTHLRAHETAANLVCRLLLEKKKKKET
ncbi:hypothetical protein KZ855_25290 [Pseudomonas aeruginosa]|nr:hypothetical protein [Pseudomonas aeruginosa]